MLGSQEQRTEGMKRQAQELIDQAYNRGFKAGVEYQKENYQDSQTELVEQGRNEAWEAAKKISLMSFGERNKILGTYGFNNGIDSILCDFSASEAITKIREYEAKKREEEETSDLHIGDEVTFLTIGGEIITGVITGVCHDTHEFRIMRATDGGECYCCKAKRTGRHFPEIAEVLKKMKEDAE